MCAMELFSHTRHVWRMCRRRGRAPAPAAASIWPDALLQTRAAAQWTLRCASIAVQKAMHGPLVTSSIHAKNFSAFNCLAAQRS